MKKPNPTTTYSRIPSSIEALEPRIAPAVTIVNAHLATYTDVDGDRVQIKVQNGDLHNATFTTVSAGLGDQLEVLDLTGGQFEGANLSIKATKSKTGDGLVNIGAINATGEDLGKISINGDLGQVDVGADNPTVLALKSLTVRSLGLLGLSTQGGTGDLISDINGTLGTLKVKTDIVGATVNITGATANLESATIGGSILGGSSDHSGAILSEGGIGTVRIGGNLVGGAGANSGIVSSVGVLGNVTLGGSLIGGSGDFSGQITSVSAIGSVKIGQDIQGGAGFDSGGVISLFSHIDNLVVGGSVVGGTGDNSGFIFAATNLGTVTIAGDVQGGTGSASGRVANGEGTIGTVHIGGSVLGGEGQDSGSLSLANFSNEPGPGVLTIAGDVKGGAGQRSGDVLVVGTLQSLQIGGSVIPGPGPDSGVVTIRPLGV